LLKFDVEIKMVLFCLEPWWEPLGLLTGTLKKRRARIVEHYAAAVTAALLRPHTVVQ